MAMRFLRLLFWLLLALLAALFMGRNWTDVTVDLWGNVVDRVSDRLAADDDPLAAASLATAPRGRKRAHGELFAESRPRPGADHRARRMSRPIYIAIDTPDIDQARGIVQAVGSHAGGIKLGLEFFLRNGRAGVMDITHLGLPIFLDLKLHDIPNTVAKAIMALRPFEPAILTVHAAGGRAMMEDAKAAASTATKVVAVTVLTSLDGSDLKSIGVAGQPQAQVERLAALAQEAGLDGIVCSGQEVAAVRKAWPHGFFVVPGIRPADAAVADQKRVMTPRAALDAGASILVIGRPVTAAEDPLAALRAIEGSL
jgi:orotidine-5'-phosphate decarboxylase